MKQIHHKDYINALKLQNRICKTIFFFALVGVGLYVTHAPTISPCPADGCAVKTVYAKEEASELEQITTYIIRKFEPLGKEKAVWALKCFGSESSYNPKAYNYNRNGTWDYGIAQWNQVHGQTIDELQDWKHQIDLAYNLFIRRGKAPWYGAGCH